MNENRLSTFKGVIEGRKYEKDKLDFLAKWACAGACHLGIYYPPTTTTTTFKMAVSNIHHPYFNIEAF